MLKKIFMLVVLSATLSVVCFAADPQKIELTDHSVIFGTVIEMKDGNYRIKTPAMGEITIEADKILSIRNSKVLSESRNSSEETALTPEIRISEGKRSATRAKRREAPSNSQSQANTSSDNLHFQQKSINSRVQSMTSDGNFLNQMMDLSGSSEMGQVMSDPEIMEAISNNDYDFLMNNDKMKELMDSEGIKDLLGDF